MKDKGKRKVFEDYEGDKSCKMKENTILEKVDLEADAKREQWMKRSQQRNREN